MTDPKQITLLLLALLSFSLIIQLVLYYRQIKHLSKNRNEVPTRFQKIISIQQHLKAIDYFFEKVKLKIATTLIDYLLLYFFTIGGFIYFVVIETEILSEKYNFSPFIGSVLIVGVIGLVNLITEVPLSFYKQFVIEEKFGFNKMNLNIFFSDLFKTLLIAVILGIPLLTGIIWLVSQRTSIGDFWWILLWAIVALFSLAIQILYPVFIAPIFNKFSPLQEGKLKSKLESLLKRCDFSSGGLYLMDGSKRSSHGNAFFAGLGKARRIVLFDTLVERLSDDEIEAVLAHELGHYKCGHVPLNIITQLIFSFVMFATFGFLIDYNQLYLSLGIGDQTSNTNGIFLDTAFLIIFFSILPMILFPFQPITSMLSRKHEFEADRYAATNSQSEDLISALVKLYRDNAAPVTTDRWFSMFFDSHPPASIRINALEFKEAK